MKNKLIRILPLVLLAAGCTREIVDPLAENRGLTVDFQLSTYYTQGALFTKAPDDLFDSPVTKTVFSGKDENGQDVTSSSQKERIDWKDGDKVDLMILKAGDPKDRRVYEIKAFTTEGNLKSKSTSVSSDNPFTFKGSGDYYIFATYPSHSIGKALKTGNGYDYGLWNPSSTTGGFGLHLPAGLTCSIVDKGDSYVVMDDMDYAVMTAGKSVNLSSPQAIELDFKPFFNAYQLLLTNTETTRNYKLETLTITCTSGFLRTKADVSNRLPSLISADGTMSWNNYTPGTDRCIRSFTYNFKQLSGYSEGIPFNKPLDITLLALPIAQSGISITFTFSGGITRTLTLDPSVTLAPSHKLRIYNIGEGSEEWIYVLDVEPVARFDKNEASAATTTTSYKVKSSYRYKEGNESGTREPVKWATEINMGARDIDANSDWRRISSYSPANSDKAGWISFDNTSLGNGGKDVNETRSITASQYHRHVDSNNPDAFFKDAISMNVHPSGINNLSDEANAIDLSMYDLGGNRLSGMTSANCYVVSAPGWYKFPLVYGNTLKNGSDNMGAVQSYHVRHDGGAIGQPWIRASLGGDLVNDYSAALVWQDNKPECSYTGCNNRSHGVIDKLKVRMDNGMAYMYFYVPQHSIQPGNNLLALKKGGDIVWSWHIWITDQPLEPKDGRYLSTLIGWTPISLQGGNGGLDVYPARSEELKIVQVTSDGQKIPEGMESEILVLQEGNVIQKLRSDRIYRYGRGVYFQYGRKDPMFPAQSTGNNNRTQEIYDQGGTMLAGGGAEMPNVDGNGKDKGFTVKNPAIFLLNQTPFQDGGAYWSMDVKTVYDPSPIGYRVIDRYYQSTGNAAHFYSSYAKEYRKLNLNNQYNNLVEGERRGYPGAYLGSGGNLYLPSMGLRESGHSGLTGAPISRTNYGTSASNFWCAEGTRFVCDLSGTYKAGYVTSWNDSGYKAEGYPVLCIVE